MIGFSFKPGAQQVPPAAIARKLVLAIGAGQSNEHSFGAVREGQDSTTRPHINVFHTQSGQADYQQINQSLPPKGRSTYFTVNPGNMSQAEYRAQELLDLGYCDDVLMVPCASGSTDLCTPGQNWYPGPAGGANNGALFENMIAQANLAYTAAQARFPGHAIEVALFWVQGEDDGNNNVPQATYQARFAQWVQHARARITGAANATVVQGSMVPDKWSAGGSAATAGHRAINRAHVAGSLPAAEGGNAGVLYSRGSDLDDLVGNDNLHYYPTAYAREQGRRLAQAYVRARSAAQGTGPAMTSGAAITVEEGHPLNLALAASGATHKTFHIVGGPHAALFERSDPYDDPRLRMAGNGNVPAVGNYLVQVAARDGAGIYGPPQTIMLTVTAASVASAVSWTASAAGIPAAQTTPGGAGGGYVDFANRDFAIGLGVVMVVSNNPFTAASGDRVKINGVAATEVANSGGSGSFVAIYTVPLAAAGSFTVRVNAGASSRIVSIITGTLVGANGTASGSAIRQAASGASPAATGSALTVSATGLGLAIGRANSATTFITWQGAGVVEIGELGDGTRRFSGAVIPASHNAAVAFASESNQGQTIAAAAWGLMT